MKIITINIHKDDIKRLKKYIGTKYHSRSELLRVALENHINNFLNEIVRDSKVDIKISDPNKLKINYGIEANDHYFKVFKIIKK